MSKRVISFELSPEGLSHAVEEVERFRDDMIKACDELLRQLTEFGVETAITQVELRTDGWTKELEYSLYGESRFDGPNRTGIVRTTCPYAALVEFGTGVEGESNPHPEPDVVGWDYDSEGHHGDEGWWYYNPNDDRVHWTKGEPSKPFMWYTRLYVELEAPSAVIRIFSAI